MYVLNEFSMFDHDPVHSITVEKAKSIRLQLSIVTGSAQFSVGKEISPPL